MSYYKPRYKICKQVGENIWKGHVANERYGKYYYKKIKRSKLYYKLFRQEKILRAYYGNLTKRQFKNIFKKTFINAAYKQNPLLYLETRLDIFLVRVRWVNSIFEAKQFILHGHILVNGRVITYCNYTLKNGDIVQVNQVKIPFIVDKLLTNLKNSKELFLTVPKYIHVNYNIMSAILLKLPTVRHIPYLVKLNPLNIKNFYNL